MYLRDYLWFLLALVVCAIFSGWASARVRSAFNAFSTVQTRSNMTGYDAAQRLLRAGGATEIRIGRVKGTLSDHYHPKKGLVNLSESTYGSNSVAAVAVAAHEVGHVMQKKRGYLPYTIRSLLVPIANFGSYLALPLVLIGIVLDGFVYTNAENTLGFTLALVGVVAYSLSTIFMLVTLPVEFNASKRAKQMLAEEGILTEEELVGADKVLSAAALTYVASLLTSLLYFLRFFVWVLTIFGRRRR
ncbi:MAG: zinc metallopeptidase [Clostridia bacterium]|nr:zinc metallopeptidase [Clostridia bacterium]